MSLKHFPTSFDNRMCNHFSLGRSLDQPSDLRLYEFIRYPHSFSTFAKLHKDLKLTHPTIGRSMDLATDLFNKDSLRSKIALISIIILVMFTQHYLQKNIIGIYGFNVEFLGQNTINQLLDINLILMKSIAITKHIFIALCYLLIN